MFIPLVAFVGCVDVTPPWERASEHTGGAGGVGFDARTSPADSPGAGGGGGSTGTPEIGLPAPDVAGSGGIGGAIDGAVATGGRGSGGGGGPIDAPQSDASLGEVGGGPDTTVAGATGDAQVDVPLGGAGGGTLDGAVEVDAMAGNGVGGQGGSGTGGRGTGGSGTGGARTGGASGTGGATVPTSGLVIYYSCNQVTGPTLADNSNHGRDATLAAGTGGSSGGYAFGGGRVNDALRFVVANKGYASIPSTGLDNATRMTIATWVYLNSAVEWQRVWDFGKDKNVYMFLTPKSGTGNKFLRFGISLDSYSSEQYLDGLAELPTGVWKHVAVVLDSGGGLLYVDGQLVNSNSEITLRPADLGVTPNNYIGRSQYSEPPDNDPYLDGNIDEFRVYDRALTAAEIRILAGQ